MNHKLLYVSSRYAPIKTAIGYCLELGFSKEDIIVIPQPVPSEEFDPDFQFHCLRYEEKEMARCRGINPFSYGCEECPKLNECELHHAKFNAESHPIIFMHSAYLRGYDSTLIKEWLTDRHLVLDEYMDDDLLGMSSFTTTQVKQFQNALRDYLAEGPNIQEGKKEFGEALILFCDRLMAQMESAVKVGEKACVTSLSETFAGIQSFYACGYANKLERFISRQLKKGKHEYYSLIEELGKIQQNWHDNILVMPFKGINGIEAKAYFSNPVELERIRSISMLDATNTEGNARMVLNKCMVNDFRMVFRQNPLAKQAKTIHIIGKNYSRSFFKKYEKNEITKLQNQLNKLLAIEGIEKAVLISFMGLCGKLKSFLENVPRLTVIDGIHFGGQITGHNFVVDYFNQNRIPLDKAGMVVLGTPRPNPEELIIKAFAHDKFGLGDQVPEFDKDNLDAEWHDCHDYKLKFMTYKDDFWKDLEFFFINHEILQSVGRGASRGVKTIVVNNFPLPMLRAERGGWVDFVGKLGKRGFDTRLILEKELAEAKQRGRDINEIKKSDLAKLCGINPRSGSKSQLINEVLKAYLP